jgi:hypothetical protein
MQSMQGKIENKEKEKVKKNRKLGILNHKNKKLGRFECKKEI